MATTLNVDLQGFRQFFGDLEKAASGDFRKELETFLDGIGNEFLRIVEDEIVSRKVMDTRQLLASFHKDAEGNVWNLDEGGLVLEVGSSVEYAGYVNDGHWTNPKGVSERFVPGSWEGDRFIYDPGAKGGMLLKQHWVEGKHYFDAALRIIDKMFPDMAEAKLQQWVNKYFGG